MENGISRKRDRWKMENGKCLSRPRGAKMVNGKLACPRQVENSKWKMPAPPQAGVNGKWYPVSGIRHHISYIRDLIFAVILILTGFYTNTSAQSVDSLINEALQNNPQLKALESRIKAAGYRSEAAGYLPPPELGLEFSQVPLENPNPFNQALSQNLSVSQMFMLGGKLSAMSEAERKNVSIAEKEYESYKLRLISEIKSKYFELWMNEHHMELRDENIELLRNLFESTEKMYITGKSRYSDLLMIKAEIASNETQNHIFENQASAALYRLNSLLGRDLNNRDLEVYHAWSIDSLMYSPGELEEILLSSNPEIAKMEQMIEMNELEMTVNDKELIPDLMLKGMIMRMPRGMFLTTKTPVHSLDGMGKTEYMYGLMASVNLPFAPWSAGRYSAREEELNSNISGLSSEKYDMQRRMLSRLKEMLISLKSADEQINLYSKQVIPLYKETLNARMSEYLNSRISINDLISTIQMLVMKDEEQAEFKMNYQMIFGEIESMVGKRLNKIKE